MNWTGWFPWRWLVSWLARSHGFMDPLPWLTRIRRFAQPSEVSEPVELLRAGVLFHARGIINTKAIQHNLDWIWPYWVERQFNPADPAFIPRAFSFSHINLTHRNWTAVGLPGVPLYPIVDPRGLVTPLYDGWSLDFWLLDACGRRLAPSKLAEAEQQLELGDNLRVVSRFQLDDWQLTTEASLEAKGEEFECVVRTRAAAPPDVRLAAVIRPYNPEGVSFIEAIRVEEDSRQWHINGTTDLYFNHRPDQCVLSTYRDGDVANRLDSGGQSMEARCPVSMASGAALFSVGELERSPLEVRVPIGIRGAFGERTIERGNSVSAGDWRTEMGTCSRLNVPDPLIQRLYETAVGSLILHSPGPVYPGPYTYKRFWYRDAAFILHALVTLGADQRVRHALDAFPQGQTASGYFRSQEGEWDSNGEVLWILQRYLALTGQRLPEMWRSLVEKAARWILRKRLPKNLDRPHAGLLPAGFSAEHLGLNDFYYWDDFWGVAGLRAAAKMTDPVAPETASRFAAAAGEFLETIVGTFPSNAGGRFAGAVPASPYRRMDAGAVGSLAADYPLQLFPPGDPRMINTVAFLLANNSWKGGFFQDMIHSGINAYLTLHLAQVLLRSGDARARDLVDTVARLASPTGQWPEAIHPRTGGGCMGDGQHVWASAEWALILRNLFVREEGDRLVVGAGLFPRWLEQRELLSFGPTLTPFGPVTVRLEPDSGARYRVNVQAEWREGPPGIILQVPGYSRVVATPSAQQYLIERDA